MQVPLLVKPYCILNHFVKFNKLDAEVNKISPKISLSTFRDQEMVGKNRNSYRQRELYFGKAFPGRRATFDMVEWESIPYQALQMHPRARSCQMVFSPLDFFLKF
jgi:hypothetical protein